MTRKVRRQPTVGEMIAAHHAKDALWRARQDANAFKATDIGAAFLRFENSLADAWRRDTEFGYRDGVGEKAANRAWERHDADRRTFMTLLGRMMRKHAEG